MATVEQILRDSGFTDEQIKGLEPRAITAFSGVLSQAESEHRAAEQAKQAYSDMYEHQIAPALVSFDERSAAQENEKARMAAELAFYRTQNEQGRAAGFIPSDAPTYPGRDQQGRYVANAPGSTPGSPQYVGAAPQFDVNQIYQRAGDAVSVIADIQYEHQRLYNQPMPITPSELIKQADAHRMDPKTYASRTFNWDQKKQELATAQQKLHDDQIRADERRIVSERLGSNPDIRQPVPSRFSDIRRAQDAKLIPDPLSLNETERRQATRTMIREDISKNSDA